MAVAILQYVLYVVLGSFSAYFYKVVTPTSLLIRGGHVLTFDPNSTPSDPRISFPVTDILIEGDKITKISSGIKRPLSLFTRVIDARGFIVSPGFVDAHRHLFQVAERSIIFPKSVADMALHEYLGYIELAQNHLWTPEDVYWGQLAAASAAISGGVTTVLDHSHISWNNESVESAVRATIDSGLRSVYALAKLDHSSWESWQSAQLLSLGKRLPGGVNGRVTLGFAYDFIGMETAAQAKATMDIVHEAGISLTTFHYAPAYNFGSILQAHANYPLDDSFVVSHCTRGLPEEYELLQRVGAGMVSTPSTDGPMAMGDAEAFGRMHKGMKRVGLGIDIGTPANMFATMRLALQTARITRNEDLYAGRTAAPPKSLPRELTDTIAHAARFATLGGAESMHMESSIGSLAEGKQADLMLIAVDSPDILGISPSDDQSLLSAFVMHANPSDVNTVIISGEIVKERGELKRVKWYGKGGLVESFSRQREDLSHRLRSSTVNWTAQFEGFTQQMGLAPRFV